MRFHISPKRHQSIMIQSSFNIRCSSRDRIDSILGPPQLSVCLSLSLPSLLHSPFALLVLLCTHVFSSIDPGQTRRVKLRVNNKHTYSYSRPDFLCGCGTATTTSEAKLRGPASHRRPPSQWCTPAEQQCRLWPSPSLLLVQQ